MRRLSFPISYTPSVLRPRLWHLVIFHLICFRGQIRFPFFIGPKLSFRTGLAAGREPHALFHIPRWLSRVSFVVMIFCQSSKFDLPLDLLPRKNVAVPETPDPELLSNSIVQEITQAKSDLRTRGVTVD